MARPNKIRRITWIALDEHRSLFARGPPKRVFDLAEALADSTANYIGVCVYEVDYVQDLSAPPDQDERLTLTPYVMHPEGKEWDTVGTYPKGYGPVPNLRSGYRTRWIQEGNGRLLEKFIFEAFLQMRHDGWRNR